MPWMLDNVGKTRTGLLPMPVRRHTLPNQGTRLRVDPDIAGVRYLLDGNDRIHVRALDRMRVRNGEATPSS
jgi:hypothetical protein